MTEELIEMAQRLGMAADTELEMQIHKMEDLRN
jgi:hypothetical protein